ncbi:ATP-binding cassette domain-containing protein [Erysipelothrix urinaevulpis]|uniref:ATP-binding cassette domain-containing protein n=1 Tax=Erysipelothrix urinaevulpis TaxID=2683717 RepID=UPI0013583ACF|nr:ABC transporter ATP-binding protein [Erysipelothrix urinaevulpis]
MLKLKNMNVSYGNQQILKDINLSINRNSKTLITGPSGSGKSTLGMLISGLLKDYDGLMTYNKNALEKDSVAIMFQNPQMQFCMRTVKSELVFVLENMNTDPEVMDTLIRKACEFSQISHLLEKDLETLSGGEKQSVSLACIYLMNREIVILDEPFANLDDDKASFIMKQLLKLHQQNETILIVIDHQLKHYPFEFDHLVSIEGGQVNLGEISNSLQIDKKIPTTKSCSIRPYIHLKDVSVVKNKQVLLEPLSETIYQEELVAITGPSGSGKTTLLYALLGLNRYRGVMTIKNRKFKAKHLNLGFVFQNPMDQFIASSVYDEVYQVCQNDEEVKTILEEFKLWEKRNVSPFKLSQGQQRRLALGIILSHDFDLIVLDEPTYGQDLKTAQVIMERIFNHVKQKKQTIVFTSHDQELVNAYADRIITIETSHHEKH